MEQSDADEHKGKDPCGALKAFHVMVVLLYSENGLRIWRKGGVCKYSVYGPRKDAWQLAVLPPVPKADRHR